MNIEKTAVNIFTFLLTESDLCSFQPHLLLLFSYKNMIIYVQAILFYFSNTSQSCRLYTINSSIILQQVAKNFNKLAQHLFLRERFSFLKIKISVILMVSSSRQFFVVAHPVHVVFKKIYFMQNTPFLVVFKWILLRISDSNSSLSSIFAGININVLDHNLLSAGRSSIV